MALKIQISKSRLTNPGYLLVGTQRDEVWSWANTKEVTLQVTIAFKKTLQRTYQGTLKIFLHLYRNSNLYNLT